MLLFANMSRQHLHRGFCQRLVAKVEKTLGTTKTFLIKSQKKFLSVRKSVCLCIRFLKRAKAQHE